MTNGTLERTDFGALPLEAAAQLRPELAEQPWNTAMPKVVGICDTQPVTAEGMRTLLGRCGALLICTTRLKPLPWPMSLAPQ